jgi:hypothetical protein
VRACEDAALIADGLATVAVEWLVGDGGIAGFLQLGAETVEVFDEEGRMSFPGGDEVGIDAEVDFDVAGLEPAAARREMGGFWVAL